MSIQFNCMLSMGEFYSVWQISILSIEILYELELTLQSSNFLYYLRGILPPGFTFQK